MMQPTDETLVKLAQAGDKTTFGHLVDRYQAKAMSIALRIVADESSAQDLAQEAMLRVLGHRYLGTEHLLLGIVREDGSAAATILRELGLNLGQVRPQILEFFIQSKRK
jgi:hypothetical protein